MQNDGGRSDTNAEGRKVGKRPVFRVANCGNDSGRQGSVLLWNFRRTFCRGQNPHVLKVLDILDERLVR